MSDIVILAGAGNMGYAMLAGWVRSKLLKPADAFVVEPNADLRARAAALGVTAVDNVEALPADLKAGLVVLAVKPQVIRAVTEGYRAIAARGATFVSVAAGTKMETFEAILGASTPVVRCMPNTPAAIGKGMMVVVANANVEAAVLDRVKTLVAAIGEVATIDDENLMDAVTAVSGSGPAYVFHFIECLTEAAVTAGLPRETAKLLALQTVFGAASLAAETREDPAVLRQQVTSPNGTTAAALGVLMGGDRMKTLVTEAVEAARLRGVELAK